jgi:hypothetical protein
MTTMTETETIAFRAAIGTAAVDEYLETGKPVRPADIARRMGVSDAKVRKAIREDHGFVTGCTYTEVQVPTFSKDYPGMQHGSAKAAAYLPNLSTLRAIIIGKK